MCQTVPRQHPRNYQASLRRLARRGGVKRISGLIYEETRGVLEASPILLEMNEVNVIPKSYNKYVETLSQCFIGVENEHCKGKKNSV